MLDMYKGVVNSPETTITNDISNTDVFIYVLDDTRIPDILPNLMTIGTGTNAETIKVISKDGLMITVERGFQGIAKSWPSGSVIARNFTEYDYGALVQNIKDLNNDKVDKSRVLTDVPAGAKFTDTLTEVVDNLTSDDSTKALSAKMGKELFQSVSDGKQVVATAIADKGVPTSSGDTFQKMAINIGKIETKSILTGDALVSEVLAGRKFYKDNPDNVLVGTMPMRTNHWSAKSISRSGTALLLQPPEGYYPGTTSNAVQHNDPNFIAANILSGKTLFGLEGTASTGKKFASGTVTSSASKSTFTLAQSSPLVQEQFPYVTVSGLTFKPTVIIIRNGPSYSTVYDSSQGSGSTIILDRFRITTSQAFAVSDASPVVVSGTGFLLPAPHPNPSIMHKWYAYE